jgi:hypothetical protein
MTISSGPPKRQCLKPENNLGENPDTFGLELSVL